MSLKILFIGSLSIGQTSLERMKALKDLGHEVVGIESQHYLSPILRIVQKILNFFDIYPDFKRVNNTIINTFNMQNSKFDIVWVDKGVNIWPSTLQQMKEKMLNEGKLVHFNPDDPFGHFKKGWSLFLKSIPLYDIHFVSRGPNIEEYREKGAKKVFDFDRSFSKLLHIPLELNLNEKKKYKTNVGFIGTYAPYREAVIAYLIKNNIEVAVYGNGWENKPYWNIIRPHFRSKSRMGEEYVKILNGMQIALHFLRRENRDEQDSRSFEIPACGVFMLAERSPKHESFFVENIEAVFFDTKEELLEKVNFYLKHPEETQKIALNGYRRSITSGYDHHSRMQRFLAIVTEELSFESR